MTLPIDPDAIRANFPAFQEEQLRGWAFFENAGGSYMARPVIERFHHYFRVHKVQPYGEYAASREAGTAMDTAYEKIATALGTSIESVHIGPSTSANTYSLARAFSEMLAAGDAIIVTNQCHEANTGAFRKLEKADIEVREWNVDPETGLLEIPALERLLDKRVKMVAFPHCSNIAGHINPVSKICERAHAVGAFTVVDGVSYAPHSIPDIKGLGADIYLFSAYKTYGPHQGIMVVAPELARELPNQGHYFNSHILRKRLVPAGPDHAQIAACSGIIDYFDQLATIAGTSAGEDSYRDTSRKMRQQETLLLAPLMDYLRSRNDLRIIGPTHPEGRVPTVSVCTDRSGGALAARLSEHKIMAGGGHFYARRFLEALGIDPDHGVLRMSFVHYTTPQEIRQLVSALDRVL